MNINIYFFPAISIRLMRSKSAGSRYKESKSMINLRDKDRRKICQLAQEYLPQGVELWAFGSRVKGTSHDSSDLDIVLVSPADHSLDADHFVEFKCALQQSNIPIFVQVLDWNHIPPSFRDNIQKRYHVLFTVAAKEDNDEPS